jgi:hypothetical protein
MLTTPTSFPVAPESFFANTNHLMVASKLSRLVTGRASRLASDVCRSAAILKMQGSAVVTSTSDASDELPPLLRIQFYAGILPALGDLLYAGTCTLTITTSNHPPTTDTKHMQPETWRPPTSARRRQPGDFRSGCARHIQHRHQSYR